MPIVGTIIANTPEHESAVHDLRQSGNTVHGFHHRTRSATATATESLTVDTIHAWPIYIPRAQSYDRLRVDVTVAVASSNIRAAIYAQDQATYKVPGALILDAGTAASTSTGVLDFTISLDLSRGWYWAALNVDLPGVGMRAGAVAETTQSAMAGRIGTSNSRSRLQRAFTFAAFPSDESAETYTENSGNSVLFGLFNTGW